MKKCLFFMALGLLSLDLLAQISFRPAPTTLTPSNVIRKKLKIIPKLTKTQKYTISERLLENINKIEFADEFEVTVGRPMIPNKLFLIFQNTWRVYTAAWEGPLEGINYENGHAIIDNQEGFVKEVAADKAVKVNVNLPLGQKYLVDCRVEKIDTYWVKIKPAASGPDGLVFKGQDHINFILDLQDKNTTITITGFSSSSTRDWSFFGCEFTKFKLF